MIDAAGDPDYQQCVARVLGEMYTLGGYVQVDERDGCTWLDCWDARLLMYVGRDGVRVLRQRVAGGGFAELLRAGADLTPLTRPRGRGRNAASYPAFHTDRTGDHPCPHP